MAARTRGDLLTRGFFGDSGGATTDVYDFHLFIFVMVAVTHFMRTMKGRNDIMANWTNQADWDVQFVSLAKIAHIERVLEAHFVMSECFFAENLQGFFFKAFQNIF